MVTDVDIFHTMMEIAQVKGMLVEIVGTAGAGKTALFKTLKGKKDPSLHCGDHPEVWKLTTAPFYIKNLILLFPTLLRVLMNGEGFLRRREIAYLALLNGWDEHLANYMKRTNQTFIVDQGPLFFIAYLSTWATRGLFKENMNGWWENIYRKWSKAIDLVIWLDASDTVLSSRINSRSQEHHLKGVSDKATQEWIEKYRKLYSEILTRLTSYKNDVQIIRIDTGENSMKETISYIIPELLRGSRSNR